ncbi:hypothetical protein [Rubrobacter aplysinae]|uniref:hypothetical protein n=1 Tax=Rubrobacter aplysinae TaxID=909625 RepID=UPI00064C053A|nr:hypothetical protein [Rubrobacter aplysinae]
MDSYETYFALREAGIYLALSEDRDRLHCEPAAELAPELAEAVADNHDLLLKKELLRELVRFVAGRIAAREGTATRHLPSIPAAITVFESMSVEHQEISDALEEQTVDDFKRTMRQWSRSALALYETVREQEIRDGNSEPDAGTRSIHETPADESPAAPEEDHGRHSGEPLQQSLLT